jgi:hypothetical protein
MIFSEVDDLRIVHNDLSGCDALSLFGIVRNELYYLPAFLDHYRRLGVVRFVILDDQSDDGSREFLTAQPDVMLLGSARRYGERVFPDQVDTQLADVRMVHAWRTLMLKRYSLGRWALLVDADEFLRLPPGVSWGGSLPMPMRRDGVRSCAPCLMSIREAWRTWSTRPVSIRRRSGISTVSPI